MSVIGLKVDLLPGTSIENACEPLCKLAGRLLITIRADFNDIVLIAQPGSSPAHLRAAYERAVAHGLRIAVAYGSQA